MTIDPTQYRFAGIYRFTNLINGKIYVGQAQDLCQRIRQHIQLKGKINFISALRKHGIDAFAFEVLEQVTEVSELDTREQHWLDKLRPYDKGIGYNVCKVAGTTRGRKRSPEEMANCRKASAEWVSQNGHPMLGKTHSESARQKIAIARTGKSLSEEHRKSVGRKGPRHPNTVAAIRKQAESRKKKIAQIDLFTGEILRIWEYGGQIQIEFGFSATRICNACNGGYYHQKNKTTYGKDGIYKGFKWQYI